MHTRYFLFAVALFFISFSSALANVSNLSSDPSYASKFTFYCASYGNSFESGKHYITQSGPCTFSLPSSIGTNSTIGIYQGTVGNSALFSGEQVPGFFPSNTTLVSEDQNTFSGVANETDFFSVVYSNSLDAGVPTMQQYLTGATTTLPTGAVLNQNYFLIPWKWGPKPVADFNPVVIVPDVLDTWQKETGFVVDPVFHMYQNLIDTFVANGYNLNQTLYVFPYDWRDSNTDNAQALSTFVEGVKTTCGCSQVDLVTHGAGGLIATKYINDNGALSSVNNVALLGVPFGGAATAYLAWEAGQIQFGNAIQNGLAQVLLTQEAKDAGFTNAFSYIQTTPVASFKDLLPATSYISGKTYPTGYPTNSFLENLQANFTASTYDGLVFFTVRVCTRAFLQACKRRTRSTPSLLHNLRCGRTDKCQQRKQQLATALQQAIVLSGL